MDDLHGPYIAEQIAGEGSAEGSYVQQQLLPSSPAGSSTSLNSYKARTRTTVVCAECKRLKLRCDRQVPCSKCVQRDTASKCVYDFGAEAKIDVHSLHKAQLRDRNLLLGIADAIGILENERNAVVGADCWPPYDGFKFTIDPTRIRGTPIGISTEPSFSNGGPNIPSLPTEPATLVAFSKPVTHAIPDPVPTRLGRIPMPAPASRRPQAPIRHTLGAEKILDLASCTFQANSITVPVESTNHLRMNCSSLGWEPQVAYRSAAVLPAVVNSSSAPKGLAQNVLRIAPKHSEIDFHDAPRPKDTLVMALAYRLFVMPALEALPNDKTPSAVAGSSANLPIPPPSQPSPLLVTPLHIKRYLPSIPWRSRLWTEFESLMVIHDGMGGSGRIRWLKKRIEKMFEWADLAIDDDQTVPSQDAGEDSWSTYTPSSLSSGGTSSSSRRGASSTNRSRFSVDPNEVPRPPTLALFAVASAVFALGALDYECRKAHREAAEGVSMNSFSSDGPKPSAYSTFGPGVPAPTLPDVDPMRDHDSATRPAMGELPETTRSHALHSLSRACLLAHNALDLPPSLDYLYAHMLNWTFLLHPSSSLSSTNTVGEGTIHGVASGTVCQIDPSIWKELGSCVNVARTMGLGIVDEAATGGSVQLGPENPGDEEMSLWEREMRRRVWWMLVLFDQKISEYVGHSPLIGLNPSSCRPPSDLDDSRFDPTSTSLPSAVPSGANTTFFALKCRLATLEAVRLQLTFCNPRTGDLSMVAAQSFNSQVAMWLTALPMEFRTSFGTTAAETVFPESDIITAQACDLHIQANLMIIQLWYPFLVDAYAHPSRPESQNVLLSCASSANAIIIASQHVMDRFKTSRPLAYGHYGFGRAIYLAGSLLANMLVAAPKMIFVQTAKRLVETAIVLLEDPVLAGISNVTGDYISPEATTLRSILHQAEICQDRSKMPVGGKRKASETTASFQAVRSGRQIPYAGLDAASVLGSLELGLPPIRATPSTFATNIASHLTGLTLDEVAGPRLDHPQAARHESLLPPIPATPPLERHQGLPIATPSLPAINPKATKPRSRAPSVASYASSSQLSHSPAGATPDDTAPRRSRPSIGIRKREPPIKSGGGSQHSTKSSPPNVPSDPKRLKHVARDHVGPSVSREVSLPSPSRRGSHSFATSQPLPLHAGLQESFMSDAPHNPYLHPSRHTGDSSDHHSGLPFLQWSSRHAIQQTKSNLSAEMRDWDSSETSDVEMMPGQQRVVNPTPPPLPRGTTPHQFHDPISSVTGYQSVTGMVYDRRAEVPSPSHAMSLSDGNQPINGRLVSEIRQPQPQTFLPGQQYSQPPQFVQTQPLLTDFRGNELLSTQYSAPQYAMQEQQRSHPPQLMTYTPQPQPRVQAQMQQYLMAQHASPRLPQYQNTAQHGGSPGVVQQGWTSDTHSAASDVSQTQHIPQPPPSWPK